MEGGGTQVLKPKAGPTRAPHAPSCSAEGLQVPGKDPTNPIWSPPQTRTRWGGVLRREGERGCKIKTGASALSSSPRAREGFGQRQTSEGSERAPRPPLSPAVVRISRDFPSSRSPHCRASAQTRCPGAQTRCRGTERALRTFRPITRPPTPAAACPHLPSPRGSSNPALRALGATSPGGRSPASTGPGDHSAILAKGILGSPRASVCRSEKRAAAADVGFPALTGAGCPLRLRPRHRPRPSALHLPPPWDPPRRRDDERDCTQRGPTRTRLLLSLAFKGK